MASGGVAPRHIEGTSPVSRPPHASNSSVLENAAFQPGPSRVAAISGASSPRWRWGWTASMRASLSPATRRTAIATTSGCMSNPPVGSHADDAASVATAMSPRTNPHERRMRRGHRPESTARAARRESAHALKTGTPRLRTGSSGAVAHTPSRARPPCPSPSPSPPHWQAEQVGHGEVGNQQPSSKPGHLAFAAPSHVDPGVVGQLGGVAFASERHETGIPHVVPVPPGPDEGQRRSWKK